MNAVAAAEVRAMAHTANRVLQRGKVSKPCRDALDAELAVQATPDSLRWAVTSERVRMVDFTRTVRGRRFWILGRAIWNQRECKCLEFFDAFLTLANDTPPLRDALGTIHHLPAKGWDLPYTYSGGMAEVTYRTFTAVVARVRCLRLINALQAQAPSDSSLLPKISQLGLPAEATTDPYTGNPLHIKRIRQGWLVYSVGADFRDDGGELAHDRDVGLGP
jgi:hypothetical protein